MRSAWCRRRSAGAMSPVVLAEWVCGGARRAAAIRFRVDHAHARTALAASPDSSTDTALDRFVADAESTPARVPAANRAGFARSMRPGRRRAPSRWASRCGRRPWRPLLERTSAPAWAPPGVVVDRLGMAGGSCPAWEHAAARASHGPWVRVGDADWHALRTRPWAPPPAVRRIRTTSGSSPLLVCGWPSSTTTLPLRSSPVQPCATTPLAVALDRLAARLRSDPEAVRRPVAAAVVR